MFYVYVLKSQKDSKHYYGYCKTLSERLKNHNAGKVRSTKSRRPFTIHYYEIYSNKSDAIKREKFFKSVDGHRWLKEKNII